MISVVMSHSSRPQGKRGGEVFMLSDDERGMWGVVNGKIGVNSC